jgi:hypothetical protein
MIALEMTNSHSSSQVKEQYHSPGDIKSTLHILNTHCSQVIWYGSIFELATPRVFTSAKPWLNQEITVTLSANCPRFESQMARKRSGLLLRKELDSLSFLQSHPDVQKRFSDAGCMSYVERLQNGCHQITAEAFAKSYDGNRASVGSVEMIVDEAAIATTTSLPRSGQSWFKTTTTKNLNFRVYLKAEFRDITWKKSMPVSHLEDEWQDLFKGIQLYITSEGRYDKLMLYHFKLLDHFTGKTLLNLPFFLHKSLTKVCKKIRAEPLSMKNTLCHFGLIKLIILEELRQRGRTWQHFLFWEGFETQTQPMNEQKKTGKKQLTPQSSSRRRRALPGPPEDRISSIKSKRAKKKLDFETNSEQPTVKKTNILNFPYTDSETEPEQEDESPAIKSPEHSMEIAQDCETFTPIDEGETSKSKKSKKSQKIKELKEVIAQQEVLERVIKARYKSLSDNFAETNAAFEKLAHESVKDKKRKKKITKDYNSLWWLAKRLKRKIKKLKQKSKSHPDLQVLAQVVVNMQGDKSKAH